MDKIVSIDAFGSTLSDGIPVALAKKVKRITPNKYRLVDSYKIKCSSYLLEYTLRDKNSFTNPSPGNSREGQTHTQQELSSSRKKK